MKVPESRAPQVDPAQALRHEQRLGLLEVRAFGTRASLIHFINPKTVLFPNMGILKVG